MGWDWAVTFVVMFVVTFGCDFWLRLLVVTFVCDFWLELGIWMGIGDWDWDWGLVVTFGFEKLVIK